MSDKNSFSMDFDGSKLLAFSRDINIPLLDPSEIRVYAAGPLTNNDDETSNDCSRVREILKRVLGGYDFHGVSFRVYDPGDVTQPGSFHTAEEVYELNYEQSVLADLVVFHVNVPSLGVGCEAQIAADATVPRVTLSRTSVPVSRMFEGIFSTTISSICYDNYADLELKLFRMLPVIAESAAQSARERRPVLGDISKLQLGRVIFGQRLVHNVAIGELARRTDMKESWLRRLERNGVLAACCTAIQLNRIATATHCYVRTVDAGNLTTLAPSDDPLTSDQRRSLDNLVSYVSSRDERVPDDRAFRLWNNYRVQSTKESLEAVEFREGDERVVSVDEWHRRDQQPQLFQ